jgi:hypothetical protein
MVVEKTFLHPGNAPDLSFAVSEPSGGITAAVVQALPKPDVAVDRPNPSIKYTHRKLSDADLYFFFNESQEKQARSVVVAGRGQAQTWNAGEGLIHPIKNATTESGGVRLALVLEPYEAKFIIIGPLPSDVSTPEPSLTTGDVVAEIPSEAGREGPGPVSYTKEFNLAEQPAGTSKRLFLECDDLRDYAKVRLNGVELPARAWQPYRWDVTTSAKAGRNTLEIEVRGSTPMRGPASTGAPAPSPPITGILAPLRLVWRD